MASSCDITSIVLPGISISRRRSGVLSRSIAFTLPHVEQLPTKAVSVFFLFIVCYLPSPCHALGMSFRYPGKSSTVLPAPRRQCVLSPRNYAGSSVRSLDIFRCPADNQSRHPTDACPLILSRATSHSRLCLCMLLSCFY